MNKSELYDILDIQSPDEFEYFENMAALLEADEEIEIEVIDMLLSEVDIESFGELLDSYFDELIKMVPDKETDINYALDIFKTSMNGYIGDDMTREELDDFADAIYNFRNWYVINKSVVDKSGDANVNMRDAIFNVYGQSITGNKYDYDYSEALASGPDSYEVKLKDIVEREEYEEMDD